MNNRMLALVKQAGFEISSDGKIYAFGDTIYDITNEVSNLVRLLNQELKPSRWEGFVDRMDGSFTDQEIINSIQDTWR